MILIDTGPIVAMIDDNDPHYSRVAEVMLTTHEVYCTTDACLTESVYLLGRSVGWLGVELLRKAVQAGVIELLSSDRNRSIRAFEYMDRFRDQPCDYADASLLVAAEESGLRQVFTIDRHFYAYRLFTGEALVVLR